MNLTASHSIIILDPKPNYNYDFKNLRSMFMIDNRVLTTLIFDEYNEQEWQSQF